MKEAELQEHEQQKQHRLSISDPTPQPSPSKVYSELFANNPTAAVGSSICSGIIPLDKSHKYYHQVQGQIIALFNFEYYDFAVWTTKGIYLSNESSVRSLTLQR